MGHGYLIVMTNTKHLPCYPMGDGYLIVMTNTRDPPLLSNGRWVLDEPIAESCHFYPIGDGYLMTQSQIVTIFIQLDGPIADIYNFSLNSNIAKCI